MQTIHQSIGRTAYFPVEDQRQSVITRFITWTNNQEKYRLGWLAAILTLHGCFLTPLTILFVVISGNNIFLFVTAIVAMVMCLITNLAALPTKITIPVFLLSILIDIVLISIAFFNGFANAGAYF